MAYNRNQAKTLCTAAEYTLFEASLGDSIKQLSPVQLRGKIKRARNLRDKYRDLFKRQRLADRDRTGTKKGQRPDGNVRTEQKARLFEETLNRFERRAEDAQRAADRAAAREAAKAKGVSAGAAKSSGGGSKRAGPAERNSAGKAAAAGFLSEAARGANRRQRLQKTRSKAVQGHTRAAGKRSQARRDRRN